MPTVDLSEETIRKLYKLIDEDMPKHVGDFEISTALDKAKKLLDSFVKGTAREFKNIQARNNPGEIGNILIVDDIGVVTYQLKVLFEKEGFIVETAKDIYTAVNHFKKENYAFVIMDLMVSTEREGYLLLDEIRKIIIKDNLDTKIIVITASGKAEHKLKCINKGADRFINKDQGWQEAVLDICLGREQVEIVEE